MAETDPTYDLTLLLDAELPEDERIKVVSEVERAIQGSGTLVGRHDWGVRRLAYEIDHRVDADYHLLQFHGPGDLIEALQRSLRISDAVVRFRIIKLPPGAPPVPEVRPDPRVVEAPRPAAEAPPLEVGEVVADETPGDEAPAAAVGPEAAPDAVAPEAAVPEAASAEAPAAEEPAAEEPPAEEPPAEEPDAAAEPPDAAAEPPAEGGDEPDAASEQPAEGAPSSA